MYNKIASIILNSGKNNNYAGEVFVSQPDSNKERLAGKIFVLAEIEGKKSETQKIINFLINIFDYNYYGDEKILLRDKLEGLRIEDIFETVLARVNQGLIDFLQDEHLKINPETTNLTLGVIHEDKLYFSNYGKNKAFLIYRRKGDYEIINVEASAAEGGTIISEESEDNKFAKSKIFSAVVSGEIPAYSYFLFTNEALPEYLSSREMINIITKLPPMVAAEQIKNFLQKINSFAPFLGVIVKSTIGNGLNDLSESRDDGETVNQVAGASSKKNAYNRNAHNSISHLNYTEQKTENMLAPAGIISVKKVFKGVQALFDRLKVEIPEKKRVVKFYDDETLITTAPPKEEKRKKIDNRQSFAIKEKIVFKKKKYISLSKIVNFFVALGVLFTPYFWVGVYHGIVQWIKGLGKKDRILVGSLAACFLILIISLIVTASGNKARLAAKQFDGVVTEIDNKQAQVNLYMAVNNNSGAAEVLNNLIDLLNSSLPQNKEQQAKKETLLTQLSQQNDKLQKITRIENFQEVVNFSIPGTSVNSDNLVFLDNKLYVSDGLNKTIYNFNLKDSSRNQIPLKEAVALSSPTVNEKDLYYLAGSKVLKITGQTATDLSLNSEITGENLIQSYGGTLYLLNKNTNQIYKYNKGLSSRSNWLKESVDLSQATDFKVDGRIVVSQSNGDLIKLYLGKKDATYKTAAISPAVRGDKIVISDNNYYLLDLKNNRLINLTKEGALVKQYRLIKDNIKDFAVDEASKAIYILAGTTVYKIGL